MKAKQLLDLLEFSSKAHGLKKKVHRMKSKSNPDKSYETIEWDDGTWSCNCPGWTRRSPASGRICTHVKALGGSPYKK